MECIFCKIVKGTVPSHKIYEDDSYLVFLDAFPSMIGETLIIPKNHIGGYLFDFEESDYMGLLNLGKKVAKAIDASLGSSRTGMVVEGLEVDHVHLKLYPLMDGGISLKPLSNKPNTEEMKELALKISDKIGN